MLFTISEDEGNILGYRIARGDLNSLHSIELLQESLKEERIDVLKLSVRDSPENLYTLLDQLGLPYYVLGIVIEYKANFQRNNLIPYRNDSVEFTEYTGESEVDFTGLVKKIFATTPASYFINPGLEHVQNKENQLHCLASYINTLNKSLRKNHYSHLINFKGKSVGFITSYKEGNGGAATYAGLLPEFQGKGLYLDLVSFIQNHGKSIGQKWGMAYAQIQNTVVQKTFHRQGLRPNGYLLNLHINSFYGALKHN